MVPLPKHVVPFTPWSGLIDPWSAISSFSHVPVLKLRQPHRHSTNMYVPSFYGSNGIPRIAPHEDHEVSLNRSKCFKRLFPNPSDLRKVYTEFGVFSSGTDFFDQPHIVEARMLEEPISWWANYGASTPLLQALAFKLLVQLASSSCSERNWSTYSVIQSIKRNRLATSRAEDLVFVHCNLRLLSRKNREYKEGPTKYWDLSGDKFGIEGSELTEFAELSLDEPELERMTFDGDDEESGEGTNAEPIIELKDADDWMED